MIGHKIWHCLKNVEMGQERGNNLALISSLKRWGLGTFMDIHFSEHWPFFNVVFSGKTIGSKMGGSNAGGMVSDRLILNRLI